MIVALLLGCAVLRDEAATSGAGSTFPHPSDYDQPAAHGADWLAGGASCAACHTNESAPACGECHADYPHATGWSAGSVHGIAEQGSCGGCHAVPGLEAAERFGCTSCHASYPHPAGWDQVGTHGSYALARGDAAAVCGSCHGTDLQGGDVAAACTSCHPSYPHPKGFQSAHGGAYLKDDAICAACHATTKGKARAWTGGTSGVACSDCHASYPHAATWSVDHLGAVTTVGEGVCATCHAPGEGPATMVATCASRCHGGAE